MSVIGLAQSRYCEAVQYVKKSMVHGKNLLKREVLSLEWKSEGVMDKSTKIYINLNMQLCTYVSALNFSSAGYL